MNTIDSLLNLRKKYKHDLFYKIKKGPALYGYLYFLNIIIFSFIYWKIFHKDFDPHIQNYLTSFYFSTVTATTLGFGDIKPALHSNLLMVLISAQVIFGVLLIGLFLNSISQRIGDKKDEEARRAEKSRNKSAFESAATMLRPILANHFHQLESLYRFTASAEAEPYTIRPNKILNEEFSIQLSLINYYAPYVFATKTEPMFAYFITKNVDFKNKLQDYLARYAFVLPTDFIVKLNTIQDHKFFTLPSMAQQIYSIKDDLLKQHAQRFDEKNFITSNADYSKGIIDDYFLQILSVVEILDDISPNTPITMRINLKNNIMPKVGAGRLR